MSAAANTLSGSVPKTAHKRVSGWAQLMRLSPYVARHKLEVADRLYYAGRHGDYRHAPAADPRRDHGLHQGRRDPAGAARASDANRAGSAASLLPPEGSAHAGGVLHGAGDHLRGARRFFLLDAANPDRAFPRYRIRPAQRSARQARADGAGILRAKPHGRADVTLHERFELGAHGARARASCTAPTRSPPWCSPWF